MRHADHDTLTTFDRDLDALVTGTPASDLASNGTTDRAASPDLRRAAHRFHGLAARADRRAEDADTQRTLDAIWEQLMDAHLQPPAPATAPRLAGFGSPSRSRPGRILAAPRTSRWQAALNGLLAAALVLAIAAGLWRAAEDFGPGNGGDDGSGSQLAGLTAQDATPEGSAIGATIEMPTAEDCTVEPLTVDDVMAIVEGPYNLEEQLANLDPDATPAPPTIEPGGYPTQEQLDEIDATHRQLIACVLAGSPFQAWTFVPPSRIQQDVLQALPVFADEGEVRAFLEQLQKGLMDEQATSIASRYGLSYGAPGEVTSVLMVDPNPGNSRTLPTDQTLDVVRVGALYCSPDGVVQYTEPARDDLATDTQTYFEYSYSAIEGRWYLQSVPGAG